MDWVKTSELLVVYLAPLIPYLVKYGEGVASELGKQTAQKILIVASNAWNTLKGLIPNIEQSSLSQLSGSKDSLIKVQSELAISLEQSSQYDPENAQKLMAIVNQIRGVVYDTIVDSFLISDLQELYLRMGVGFDDLVMGTNPGIRVLVFSLLDYVNRRDDGVANFIDAIARTRPDLKIKFADLNRPNKSIKELDNLGILLAEKLTQTDLNEIYFRLGIGTDELIRRAKARAIIEYSETRFIMSELIQNMWAVNPRLINKK